jgi:16S rRNA (guanine527-N7)-methyltransferase
MVRLRDANPFQEPSSLTAPLSHALEEHNVSLPPDQVRLVARYCELLWDWNSKLNLTRHTDFDTFVARDVVDSVQLAKHIAADETVLDVGSGGGVPGMMLAILRPDLKITLSESMQKKAVALTDMAAQLELPCQVVAQRAERVLEKKPFDVVTARAVGSMAKVLRWFRPHWDSIGRLLLIKGPRWVDERKEARHKGLLNAMELRKLHGYTMSGTNSESVILSVFKSKT